MKLSRAIEIHEGFNFDSNEPFKYLVVRASSIPKEGEHLPFITYTYNLLKNTTEEINNKLEQDLFPNSEKLTGMCDLPKRLE